MDFHWGMGKPRVQTERADYGSNNTGIELLGIARYLHILGYIVIGRYFFGRDTRCDIFVND